MTRSHSAAGVVSMAPLPMTPAALTRPSRPPNAWSQAAAHAVQIASSRTSPSSTSVWPPFARTFAAASSRRARRRPASATLAPSPASASAHARPMPEEPPVTSTALPVNRLRSVMGSADASEDDAERDRDHLHLVRVDHALVAVDVVDPPLDVAMHHAAELEQRAHAGVDAEVGAAGAGDVRHAVDVGLGVVGADPAHDVRPHRPRVRERELYVRDAGEDLPGAARAGRLQLHILDVELGEREVEPRLDRELV